MMVYQTGDWWHAEMRHPLAASLFMTAGKTRANALRRLRRRAQEEWAYRKALAL